jgi:hypothetical protein
MSGFLPVAMLLGIAAVLLAAAAAFFVRADYLRHHGAAANTALTNRSATSQVIGQVSTALNQVLSYSGYTAQLLVFLDQRSTWASDNESSVSAPQVQITAVLHNSTWQITELHSI